MKPLAAGWLLGSAILAASPALTAQEIANPSGRNGVDGTGTITDRDNTRVVGTVYGPDGEPLTDVTIWVANADAPANRMRARARKTGSYMARGLGRIYTERNVHGINLRLTFEAEGRDTVEATLAVRKNELGRLDPILWPKGQQPTPGAIHVRLSGTVEDARGKPVRGARVSVRGAGGESPTESVTEKNGAYELLLWNAEPETHLLIEAPGARPTERTLTLEPAARPDVVANAHYDIALPE